MTKLQRLLSFFFSLFIVALGEPVRCGFLGPLAAALGFALFFRSIPLTFSKAQKIAAGTLWFGAISLIQLSWMTSIEFQGIYILFVYATLSIALGFFFGAFTALVLNQSINSWKRILFLTAVWTLIEWSRLFFLCGFSWNPIGMALTTSFPALQFAAVFGIFGLSFWVMGTNLLGLNVLRGRKNQIAVWAAFAVFPYLFGGITLICNRPSIGAQEIKVALVQTGLMPSEKVLLWGRKEEFIAPIRQWQQIIKSLESQPDKNWDLIVLPEAVVPYAADYSFYAFDDVKRILIAGFGSDVLKHFPPLIPPYAERRGAKLFVSNLFWCRALVNIYNTEVLAGLDCIDRRTAKNHNAAFYLSPDSLAVERYDKQVLLPLAEYLPFAFLHSLTKRYGIFDFFTQGKESKVLGHKVRFSPSICYEETFSEIVREGRQKGAELLINMTNDSYYPYSTLAEQHFYHARVRAVENGAPLLRACNTGVTAALDSFGRTVARLDGEETLSATLSCELKIDVHSTLFTFWGNAGILTLCFVSILLYFGLLNLNKKRNLR